MSVEEHKSKIIAQYLESEPTEDNTPEIVAEIAKELALSPNAVRLCLMQEGVYIKKTRSTGSVLAAGEAKKGGETKRVSKESSIADLRAAIIAAGKEPDDDIINKLTGKAAVYFNSILS